MDNSRTIRWGILGTARIAEKVSAAIKTAKNAELCGIASRSLEKANQWGKEHQIPLSFGSYQEVLECEEIDAVYIPLPPSMHYEWTIKAAEAGKHVLCEKPVALNVNQAREMVSACEENGVQFMDGVMWIHHPRTKQMKDQLEETRLGKLKRMNASFTFCWDPLPEENIRFQKELGGGSLSDLGWYCAGAILWAFEEMPIKVFATADYFNEVDLNLSAMLWFPDGKRASFDCGFDCCMRKGLEIVGTESVLTCPDFTRPWEPENPEFRICDTFGKCETFNSPGDMQETRMIEDFCENILNLHPDQSLPEMSIRTQIVCDAIADSARKEEVVLINEDDRR